MKFCFMSSAHHRHLCLFLSCWLSSLSSLHHHHRHSLSLSVFPHFSCLSSLLSACPLCRLSGQSEVHASECTGLSLGDSTDHSSNEGRKEEEGLFISPLHFLTNVKAPYVVLYSYFPLLYDTPHFIRKWYEIHKQTQTNNDIKYDYRPESIVSVNIDLIESLIRNPGLSHSLPVLTDSIYDLWRHPW